MDNFDTKSTRRSSIKSENEKAIIFATPDILEFRNFQLKKTYKVRKEEEKKEIQIKSSIFYNKIIFFFIIK